MLTRFPCSAVCLLATALVLASCAPESPRRSIPEVPLARGWRGVVDVPALGRARLEPTEQGLRVANDEWSLTVRVQALGRPDALVPSPGVPPQERGDRLHFERANSDEWFALSDAGVEHGLVVREAPAGEGPLVAELSFGALTPRAAARGADLLDAAGVVRAHYTDLHAFDASGRELDSHMQVEAGRVRLLVQDDAAVYPVTIDPVIWGAIAIASTVAGCGGSPHFGVSLDLQGEELVAGADAACAASIPVGAAVVFDRQGDRWVQSDVLTRPAAASGDRFGAQVVLADDTLVVSAPAAYAGEGAVEVFRRLGRRFRSLATLRATPQLLVGTAAPHVGQALAADTVTAVAGAPDVVSGTSTGAGAVVVYRADATGTWGVGQVIGPDAPEKDLHFGRLVALDGAHLAVATSKGVTLYERRGSDGDFVLDSTIAVANPVDLALVGDTLAIAASSSVQLHQHDTTWAPSTTLSLAGATALHVALAGGTVAVATTNGVLYFVAAEGAWGPGEAIAGSARGATAIAAAATSLLVADGADHVAELRRVATVGEPCNAGNQCERGFCVDGVCCESACGLGEVDCFACSLAAGSTRDGVCTVAHAGASCRKGIGACDAAEVCDGLSSKCPDDRLAPVGTECRPATGPCDVSEACTGRGPFCPADTVRAVGTVCRAIAGECDVTEVCDGLGSTCPPDRVQPKGLSCRERVGQCDVAEQCDGVAARCPRNGFQRYGFVCRPASAACDEEERCSGADADCPADVFADDGKSCVDGDACTQNDSCQAGRCVAGPRVCEDAPAPISQPTTPTSSEGCAGLASGSLGLLALAVLRRRRHLGVLIALLSLSVAAPARAQDADGDTVLDRLDVCPGNDKVDADHDGTPAACDCDDTVAARNAGAPDLFDGLDNDCDGRIDVLTLLSAQGGQLTSLVGRGIATNAGSRPLTTTDSGRYLAVGASVARKTGELYFSMPLGIRRGSTVRMYVDRAHRTGDHDFEFGLSDGTNIWTVGLYDVFGGFSGRYDVRTSVYGLSGTQTIRRYPLQGTQSLTDSAYFVTFRFTPEPTVEVRNLFGDTVVIPLGAPSSLQLDRTRPWQLLLWGDSFGETYRIRQFDVFQDTPAVGGDAADADGDGFTTGADCDDTNAQVFPGSRELCNARDDDCDGQGERATLYSAAGTGLLSDVRKGTAVTPSRTLSVADGKLVAPTGRANDVLLRRTIALVSDTTESTFDVVIDRPTATGDNDLMTLVGNGTRVVGVSLTDDVPGRTAVSLVWGADAGGLITSAQFGAPVTLADSPPYRIRFTLGTPSRAVVVSADGTSVDAAFPSTVPTFELQRKIDLLLVANTTAAPARVGRVTVTQEPLDTDGDGVCDALDRCVGDDASPDQDGDGFPSACDCNDSQAAIHPGATEVCDRIDQDCDAAADAQRLAGGRGSELFDVVRTAGASSPANAFVALAGGTELAAPARATDFQVVYREPLATSVAGAQPGSTEAEVRFGSSPQSQLLMLLLSDGVHAAGLRIALRGGLTYADPVVASDGTATVTTTATTTSTAGLSSRSSSARLTLRTPASGPQRVLSQLFDRDGTPSAEFAFSLPPEAGLDPGRPLSLVLVAPDRNATYAWASVAARQLLADVDGDRVCDAVDRCAAFDDRLDADEDGVPDACDRCLGPDGTADLDHDGFANGCDCNDNVATVHPGQTDGCDLVDNDCDGAVDVGNALRDLGSELLSRVARGDATKNARTFTAIDAGTGVVIGPTTGATGDVYYREPLALLPSRAGEQRLRLIVDRDARTGDHDFAVAVTDGARLFGAGLYDDGATGTRYSVLPLTGIDDQTRVALVEGQGTSTREASPYAFDFVLGAAPRIDVTTADGSSFSLRMPSGDGGISHDNLSLVLIGNGPEETYTIRSLEVTQTLDDADGDHFCDAADHCPGYDDGGVDSDHDGIVDACDVCSLGDDHPDADHDGVPDACDVCPDARDGDDADADGIPDACDTCPQDPTNDFDRDGVCDRSDTCLKGDDKVDTDQDGVADACDACPKDATGDTDEDGTCDSADVCKGNDRAGDTDGDGWCADLDCDDTRASIHKGSKEICDGFDTDCDGALGSDEFDTDGDLILQCLQPSTSSCSTLAPGAGLLLGLVALRRRRR